jgi:uncharacterized membrane protein YozB (DUF420 family)
MVLLLLGYVFIKRGKEQAHKRTMLSCFVVSVVFLICYLSYHYLKGGATRFPTYPSTAVRYAYYLILISHILLAFYVPVGAIVTIIYGLRDNRPKHRKWAKITFPIWLYVSVTGVIVYLMLYHIYPPQEDIKIEMALLFDWTMGMSGPIIG